MLKFGKKVTYRPLIVSAVFGSSLGFIFNQCGANMLISSLVGLGLFTAIFIIHYLNSSEVLFQYWEADQNEIRYSDLSHASYRLTLMLFPFKNNLTVIKKDQIESITLKENLNTNSKDMPMALPYSPILAILSPALSMSKNPVDIDIKLKNGNTVELSAARDYIYNKRNTIEKLHRFFNDFNNNNIKLNQTAKLLNQM